MSLRGPPLSSLLLLGLSSCSLLFDATALTDGGAGGGGASASTSSTTGATTTASGSPGAGGDDATISAGAAAQGGGEAAPAATTGGGGRGGGQGSGGAGGGCSGPTFCETEGADAALCFDFDGAAPLAGLDSYAADTELVTTTIDLVEDPSRSCPRAIAVRVLETSTEEPAFALIGAVVPAGQDHFVWSFATHRLSAASETASESVAIINWSVDATPCQALVYMHDGVDAANVGLYVQGNDGNDWLATGSASVAIPHPTFGQWTQVELEVDLAAATMTIRADGVEASTSIDALCGPTTELYDLDLGAHFSSLVHATAYDDFLVRYLE